MAFTDDYHQRKRKYEIQNLKKEIEYDKECAEEEKELKIFCDYDEEIKTYWANITCNSFTCGTGYANTEETAIASACSDAFPYIKTKFSGTVLFELCLHWKKGVKEIKI